MTPPTQSVSAPKKLMTVDEFWDFVNRPENADRIFELHRGEVVELSRPTKMHGIVCSRMVARLQIYADTVGRGYVTSNDAGVVLAEEPGTVVGPDVAYFTDANTFDEVHPKWGEVPPILVVEVRSPNDKPSKVEEKVRDYLTGGVKVVWVIDYEDKTVTVHHPDRILAVLKEADTLTGGDELPGFTLPVADLFRLPGDRPTTPPQPPAT